MPKNEHGFCSSRNQDRCALQHFVAGAADNRQTKSMSKNACKSNPPDIISAPAFPLSGPQLFQRLRINLAEVCGFDEPTFGRIAQILGVKANKVHFWFTAYRHTHVIAFLSLLERLPERKRVDLLNVLCRELPSLDSPRLAHDPLGISNLENLLRLVNGLTLIRGGTEFQRTFVLTALGHSFPRINGPRASVCGLDLHEPKNWVPLEGMVYFKELLPPARVRELMAQVWPRILSSGAPLVLLNSVWSAGPAFHVDILRLANEHHVVVADSKIPEPLDIRGRNGAPVHVVTLASTREHEKWIMVKVEIIQCSKI
jgi:hypothetical protein